MGTGDTPGEGELPETALGGPISYAIVRLGRIHRLRAAQLLREAGLHTSQELLMMRLWDSGPQRQVDLAAWFDTDSASMSRTVQRLERAGYVRRVPDPDDRRATLVEPTPASLALRREVQRIWTELERLTVGELTAEQQRAVLGLLRQMESSLLEPSAAE
ncbi:MarR family winged helix-turn-helix transcriptional regulator [Micromonospora musae]|uniref:MarR family winged helix-turn-helix transcriptional regulator n=1 Tax=Micromonospora musae TaxID=1894970 RepID=UPI003442C45E